MFSVTGLYFVELITSVPPFFVTYGIVVSNKANRPRQGVGRNRIYAAYDAPKLAHRHRVQRLNRPAGIVLNGGPN